MLYSKDGSIPKPETDGTEGWIEINDPPKADDGFEVVWWFPPGWVVRPVKPADEEGFAWDWSQTQEEWVKTNLNQTPNPLSPLASDTVIIAPEKPAITPEEPTTTPEPTLTSEPTPTSDINPTTP